MGINHLAGYDAFPYYSGSGRSPVLCATPVVGVSATVSLVFVTLLLRRLLWSGLSSTRVVGGFLVGRLGDLRRMVGEGPIDRMLRAYGSAMQWRVATPIAFAVVTAITAAVGYLVMFTGFAFYDDEGYILISLKTYLEGSRLYDELYTQYGPLFYQLFGAFFSSFGLEVSHDNGRLVTLTLWLATSLLAGVAVHRLAGSILIGLICQVIVFQALASLASEPMHPGGLLCFLLVAVIAVAVLALPTRPRSAMTFIGGLVAAAALVKVNIGALALISVVFAAVFGLPALAHLRVLRVSGAVVFVAMPFVLTSGHLGYTQTQVYAATVTLGAVALALVASDLRVTQRSRGLLEIISLGAGAAAVTVSVAGVALLSGVSTGGLLNGVLLGPLGRTDAFFLPLPMSAAAFGWAIVGAAGASLLPLGRVPRFGRPPPFIAPALGRLAAGVAILLVIADPSPLRLSLARGTPLAVSLSLAWVAALPSPRDDGSTSRAFGRLLLPALAVLQALHAYPVAGSQTEWSIFLFVPVGAVCFADGLAELKSGAEKSSGNRRSLARDAANVTVIALFVTVSVGWLLSPLAHQARVYRSRVPLELHGAKLLRLGPKKVRTLRAVTAELDRHCTTFISMPGLNSFYLFAGQTPPTSMNTTAWTYLFDAPTQQRLVQQVSRVNGLCALRHRSLAANWGRGKPIPQRPLVTYIEHEFRMVASRKGYEVLVRRATGPR